MDISEEALKFIHETPLAKEILLSLTNNTNTYFMHSIWNGPQAGVIPSIQGILSSEYPNTYTGKRAEEAIKVLRDLRNLGVLESWMTNCGSPSFYCFAGEQFTSIKNETPEIRKELSKLLT